MPGCPGGARKVSEKKCVQFSDPISKSRNLGLSLRWITKVKAKEHLRHFSFTNVACWCGLRVPNMFITKANVKENLGEFSFNVLLFYHESENKQTYLDLRVAFPLGGPRSLRRGNARKMWKHYTRKKITTRNPIIVFFPRFLGAISRVGPERGML